MDIRENLEKLINDNTTREDLDTIAVIKSQLDEMDAKSEKQQSDYKELLKDYTDLIKKSVFEVDNKSKIDEGQKDFSFDSFAAGWKK